MTAADLPASGSASPEGPQRTSAILRAADWIAGAIAVSWSLFQIYVGALALVDPFKVRIIHVAFALALASLRIRSADEETRPGRFGLFSAVALLVAGGSVLYVFLDYQRISARMPFVDSVRPLDTVVGVALVLLVLEITRRILGLALTVVTLAFVAYGFLGPWLPGLLAHRGMSLATFAEVNFLTTEGLLGVPVGVSADVVFYFILFSAVLEACGGGRLFIDLATSVSGRVRGGPAKIAVLASSLFGTISGSAVANVVGTGVFTIPMMKRVGYAPRFAGAVEAVASTGGQLMPPVMGAAAFVMADMMGVPYLAVVKAAIVPALLYYLGVFSAVHLVAVRDGLTGMNPDEVRRVRRGLWRRLHLVLPLAYLVVQILVGFSPTTAAVRAAAAAVVVSWVSRATRMGWREVIRSLRGGAEKSITVAVPCAAAGIIIGSIVQTGLGLKFTTLLLTFSRGELLPTLFLAMVVCIILGMGMPTTSAYILTAVLMAPALVRLGIPEMAAHLFVFYFACLSMVTPPVALAAYAAAGLAQASVWETGWVAFGMSLPSFIVAYGFVYNQGLILNASIADVIQVTVTAALGTIAIAGAVFGFLAAPLLIAPEFYSDVTGLVIFLAVVGLQVARVRAARARAGPIPSPGPRVEVSRGP
jgi:TRAP transporter 4TM/12TM fusion protein